MRAVRYPNGSGGSRKFAAVIAYEYNRGLVVSGIRPL
jgi:hypothetical protein